jgi:hypothetical protein
MLQWRTDKRYVLVNPFSGIRMLGTRPAGLDLTR